MPMTQTDNQAKRAIVMGATSGIGLEVVKVLAAQGWIVGIAGRRQERLDAIASEISRVKATACIDVTHEDATERLDALIDRLGGMDLYFHSSGIGYQNPCLDADKEMRTVITDALGATRMIIHAYKYFENHPNRPGHLAVISSIAGTKGLGAAPAYSASKRFVNCYMEALDQLRHINKTTHIHLHDIRPGFVRTALLDDGGKYPFQLNPHTVAKEIVSGIARNKSVITVDWKYRIVVFFWKLLPRCLWVRMKIVSK